MNFVKASDKSSAIEIANALNAIEPKKVFRHSSSNDWYSLEEPKHDAGDGHFWTASQIGANAKVVPYDGGFIVTFNEWYNEEAKCF